MEQQTHVHGSEMNLLNIMDNKLVIKEELEEVFQTQRPDTGANRWQAIGKRMDMVEYLRPLLRCLRLPKLIRIRHGSPKLRDGEKRRCVVKQRELLIDHDPGVNEAARR